MNQSSVQLPKSSTQTYALPSTPPNLSNVNLIFTGYLASNSQFTLNASTTLFNSAPSTSGSVRDVKGSAQADIALPNILVLGSSTVSLSGLFLSLLQQPLGQQVTINTVPVSTRGNIWLFQAKLSVPVSSAGVHIPISVTTSNRTELIKESDVEGTIGISFDLTSLFSKP